MIGLDAGDVKAIPDRMDRAVPSNLMAKAGLEIAAHDLASRARECPARAARHSTDGSGALDRRGGHGRTGGGRTIGRPPALPRIQTIKIKIGLDPAADIQRVEAVREAVGGAIRLQVDGNCGYDRDTASAAFSRMEDCSLESIEQPLPAWDLEGMAALARC